MRNLRGTRAEKQRTSCNDRHRKPRSWLYTAIRTTGGMGAGQSRGHARTGSRHHRRSDASQRRRRAHGERHGLGGRHAKDVPGAQDDSEAPHGRRAEGGSSHASPQTRRRTDSSPSFGGQDTRKDDEESERAVAARRRDTAREKADQARDVAFHREDGRGSAASGEGGDADRHVQDVLAVVDRDAAADDAGVSADGAGAAAQQDTTGERGADGGVSVLVPQSAAVSGSVLSMVGMAAQEGGARLPRPPSDRSVRLNGRDTRSAWAVEASNLLQGAGPSVFGVRGFVTRSGQPAVFARASEQDAAGTYRFGMPAQPQYVLVPREAIAPFGAPLPLTVPFVAVWLKSKRPVDGGERGITAACGPSSAKSLSFEPLPRFQQQILERWVRSPALGRSADAVLAVPLDENETTAEPASFASASVPGAALRVLTASSGCYVWSEGGRNFLVVRVDPTYATTLLTEQVKREVWTAIGS